MLTLITAQTADCLVAADVKTHTRIDQSAEDTLLGTYIASARTLAEAETGRQFMPATWDLVLDGFPCGSEIVIPKPPLTSVTHVKYLDGDGTETTWAATNYVVEAPAGDQCAPGRLRLAYGVSWPTTQSVARSVRVRFVAGYASAAGVPSGVKHALLVAVAESYKQREETIQGTISTDAAMTMARLLGPFCVPEVNL